jgi:YHS domain-containing protein
MWPIPDDLASKPYCPGQHGSKGAGTENLIACILYVARCRMEYVITSNRPFEETEALLTAALEQQGLSVQRTFSLHSAVEAAAEGVGNTENTGGAPAYSVLMLYAPGIQNQPQGLLGLYQRGGHTVINPILTPTEGGWPSSSTVESQSTAVDADDALVSALVLSGLEFSVAGPTGEACIELDASGKEGAASARLVQDPVCGKWQDVRQAEAGIEHEGVIYYVCCPLCREAFEREPGRYARVQKGRASEESEE